MGITGFSIWLMGSISVTTTLTLQVHLLGKLNALLALQIAGAEMTVTFLQPYIGRDAC